MIIRCMHSAALHELKLKVNNWRDIPTVPETSKETAYVPLDRLVVCGRKLAEAQPTSVNSCRAVLPPGLQQYIGRVSYDLDGGDGGSTGSLRKHGRLS